MFYTDVWMQNLLDNHLFHMLVSASAIYLLLQMKTYTFSMAREIQKSKKQCAKCWVEKEREKKHWKETGMKECISSSEYETFISKRIYA